MATARDYFRVAPEVEGTDPEAGDPPSRPRYNQAVRMEGVATCRNHPEREAIGICVRCRSRNCSECVTKIDGINYCVACLDAMAAEDLPAAGGSGDAGRVGALRLVGWLLLLYPLVWLMLWAAAPSGG